MDNYSKKSKIVGRLLVVFFVLISIFAVGLTSYWWINFSGFYKFFADIQINIFDSYYPFTTGILSFLSLELLFCAPLVIIKLTLFRDLNIGDESVNLLYAKNYKFLQKKNYLFLLGYLAIAVGILYGGFMIFRALFAGPLTVYKIEDIYSKTKFESNYIETEGKTLIENSVGLQEQGDSATYYFPLVPQNWDKSEVSLIISTKNDIFEDRKKYSGLLFPIVPGFVRQLFRENSITISDDAHLLEIDSSPSETLFLGIFMLIFCGAIGGTILLITRRRKKGS